MMQIPSQNLLAPTVILVFDIADFSKQQIAFFTKDEEKNRHFPAAENLTAF